MAANVKRRDIKRNLRAMKIAFLDSRKKPGGEKFEFITDVLGKVDDVMKGVKKEDAIKEVLAGYAASVWEQKSTSKKSADQLAISGFEIDQEIRFPSEDAASGFRTVLARYVTIRQHRLHIAMLKGERDDLSLKIAEQEAANAAATRLARGDLDARMMAFADEPAEAE